MATLADLFPAEEYFHFPVDHCELVAKSDTTPEHVLVYGKATGPELDADGEIIDADFAHRAMDDWFKTGANVRQMHSPFLPPAGKGMELDHTPDGVFVRSKVFDPGAMKQCMNGGYQAYSVGLSGIRKIRDARAPNGRIVDGKIVELSLVDRGANATCKLEVAKREGYDPDGAFLYLGGFTEDEFKHIVAEVRKHAAATRPAEHAHLEITSHDHTHADGLKHVHAHQHAPDANAHEGDEHVHGKDVAVISHKAGHQHTGPDEHMHVHTDGTVHSHDHDHAEDRADHDSHKHVGADFAKAAPVAVHDDPHTDDKIHAHTHTKGDKFIAAGDSHSHLHDHAEGEGSHDTHLSQHSTLIPDSQKVLRADAPAAPAPVASDPPEAALPQPPAASGRLDGAAALLSIPTQAADAGAATAAAGLAAQVADALKSVTPDTMPTRYHSPDSPWEWVNSADDPEPYPIGLKAAIPEKDGEPKTPPKGYPTDPSAYADPKNFSWPLEPEGRLKSAVSRYNAGAGKDKYDPDEWATIGKRIAAAANKAFGGGYALGDDGTIKTPNNSPADKGKASAPAVPAIRKNGVAGAIGPTAMSLLYQLLSSEVTEDGGSGQEANDIGYIAKSYESLCRYLQSEADEVDEPSPIALGLYTQVPNSLKTLHDIACPATDLAAVKAALPSSVKGSMLQALTLPRNTVQQILSAITAADAGTGRYAKGLITAASLYDALRVLAPQHTDDPGQAELDLSTALVTVRKDFGSLVDQRGDITRLPPFRPPNQAVPGAPSGAPQQPAQFIRANHDPRAEPPAGSLDTAAAVASSGMNHQDRREGIEQARADMPTPQPPPDASDFNRGTITADHQRYLPGEAQVKTDAPDDTTTRQVANRRYYTRAAGDQVSETLRTIHNNLVALHPDICPAMQDAADRAKAGGFGAATAYPHIPTPATSLPTPATVPSMKVDTPTAGKAATAETGADVQPDFIKALIAEVQQLRTDRQTDRELIERLASAPDPEAAAHRGMVGLTVDKVSHANEAQKRERRTELAERAKFIKAWLRNGNPDPGNQKALQLQSIEEELGVTA